MGETPDELGFLETFQVWLNVEILTKDFIAEKIKYKEGNEYYYALYDEWADKDSEFPYIVYRIELTDYEPNRTVVQGTLYIDIWDYAVTKRMILRIKEVLIGLLDARNVTGEEIEDSFEQNPELISATSYSMTGYNPQNIVNSVRINLDDNIPIPTDAKNVWRGELQFNIRFDRKKEIENIMKRDEVIWDLSK